MTVIEIAKKNNIDLRDVKKELDRLEVLKDEALFNEWLEAVRNEEEDYDFECYGPAPKYNPAFGTEEEYEDYVNKVRELSESWSHTARILSSYMRGEE